MKKTIKASRKPTLVLLFSFISMLTIAKTQVVNPVCEYLENPIGIGVYQPRLSWKITSDENGVKQTAYEIRVAESLSKLTKKNDLLWTTDKIEKEQSVNVVYGGPFLPSMSRVYWQVRIWDQNNEATAWSEPAFWETGILLPEEWGASWITTPEDFDSKKSPYFRTEFNVIKKVASARIYVTALGLYELHLNGNKVSDDLFTPGWTSYNKRIQYQTYDVTSAMQTENVIGAIVGEGWYSGNIGWSGDKGYYGHQKALLLQLKIDYTDGTSETIRTDENWKVASGAIISSSIYDGETYDAQLEEKGWNRFGFDAKNWMSVQLLDHTKTTLVAPQGLPVKASGEIKPIAFFKTPKGEMVFDMGQNMVGWVRLNVTGPAGTKVTLKFAEVLDKNGNFYTDNLRAAKVTDEYILSGNGNESYEPHFTFHGFRYVQLIGFPGNATLDNITGIVIHSAMAQTGSFACSDSMINQLQHNIQWGQKGNFLDVPTDCPQRDERLGWTGDAQVFSRTAAFNFNVAAFYTKWMKDLAADQLENGSVPHVIPDVLNGGGGSTAWADAALLVPWTVYLVYGDQRILEEQYASMKAWVEYMKGRAGDDLLWTGDFHFGDWLAFATTNSDYPGATTEKDLIATAYFKYSTQLLGRIAQIIGRTDDSSKYMQLAGDIKKAFVHEFVTPAGRLVSHTQTAYSLALAFDLLPKDLQKNAAAYLAGDVKKMQHLTTGFVGTPLLCKALSDNGYADLAFMLLNRKEYPSWLYPVTQGATTIWERWDGQKPDGSMQDVGMNSFNHYAYGAIGEWMYQYITGITIDENHPGYKNFMLEPHPGGGLTWATANLETAYGQISSAWKMMNDEMNYTIEIPANTTATITLPNAANAEIMVNGIKLESSKIKKEGTALKLELGSGKYTFSYETDE
ncbi:MAG: family 78 glycoside hydrolase catalytic domain [Prolixibacteraceae bacterium]